MFVQFLLCMGRRWKGAIFPFYFTKRYCLIVYRSRGNPKNKFLKTFLNLNFERKNERQYLKNSDQFAFTFKFLRLKFKVQKSNAVRERR